MEGEVLFYESEIDLLYDTLIPQAEEIRDQWLVHLCQLKFYYPGMIITSLDPLQADYSKCNKEPF